MMLELDTNNFTSFGEYEEGECIGLDYLCDDVIQFMIRNLYLNVFLTIVLIILYHVLYLFFRQC